MQLPSNILIENVKALRDDNPDRLFAKLIFPGRSDVEVTYGQLLDEGSRFANFLKAAGVKPGDVVVLIQKHSEEILFAYAGCLLYGAVPSVFAYPSVKVSAASYYETLTKLLEVCQTRFVVTYAELAQTLASVAGSSPALQILEAEDHKKASSTFTPGAFDPNSIVLLQHSSGTTGLKKGVALSNQSVVNQLNHYSDSIKLTSNDKIASWLPLYHDMGLIACFILPMACGVPLILMSPFDWVANPVLLLQTISRERCTLAWLPNFSYNVLASSVTEAQMKDVRLDSVRAFINCAEPVNAESHELFLKKFAPFGFKPSALCTCYAMAENTFSVTQGGINEPVLVENLDQRVFTADHRALPVDDPSGPVRRAVSSGRPIPGNRIRIVDQDRKDVPERSVGEIVIQSDSMLTEYFHRPDLTSQAVVDGWYFTGDLGYRVGDDLFVTGRKKDMIIVAGKNIYPQDIEDLVSAVSGVRPGRVASFGLYNEKLGTEDVVILAETDAQEAAERTKIKLEIVRAVREGLECTANYVELLPHMWLLKSSSGKISRSGNKEKYLKEIRRV